MNIDKIMEAAGKIWLNATSHGTEEPYSTLSKIILAELDKAQQPGKALTDEDIDGIALMAVPPGTTSHDVRIAGQSIEESAPEAVRVYVRGALRYARDHYGIGAPAAWLTDEEIERISDTTPPPSKANSYAEYCAEDAGFVRGLRYARDNGYLALAAGLTVDEIVSIAEQWRWRPGTTSATAIENLRARLTAAIEAKYAKP